MVFTSTDIPVINPKCSWQKFDKNNYLLCIDYSIDKMTKLYLSKEVIGILELIDGKKSIHEITDDFNKTNQWKLSPEDLLTIINTRIFGYGIFENEKNPEKLSLKDKYIWLKTTLIPQNIARKIAHQITFLFSYLVFFILFPLCVCFCLAIYLTHLNISDIYNTLTPKTLITFFIINILTLFIHEFGHSAACEKFGAKSGKIGFGFYILHPVFFSDVSDAWRLTRKQRLIVDLGGIYVQLLIIALINLYYLYSHDNSLLVLSSLIGLGMLININPFLKFDGYWALSDALNIVNLRSTSSHMTGIFCGWVIGLNNKWKSSPRNIFLVFYGLFSLVVFVVFAVYMIFFKTNSVIYFPLNLYHLIVEIINNNNLTFEWYKENLLRLIPSASFYVLIFLTIRRNIKKKKKSHEI